MDDRFLVPMNCDNRLSIVTSKSVLLPCHKNTRKQKLLMENIGKLISQ